jgi:hypothetical protein
MDASRGRVKKWTPTYVKAIGPATDPDLWLYPVKPTPWELAVGLQVRLFDPPKPFPLVSLLAYVRLREPQELRSCRVRSDCAAFSQLVLY